MEQTAIEFKDTPVLKRISLWLICAAAVFIVILKPDRAGWEYFHVIGWPIMALSFFFAWRLKDTLWLKTLALFAYTIIILYTTNVDSNFTDSRLTEFGIKLGIGLAVIPALLAKYWLKTPLQYSWLNGKWSWKMWLWLPAGFGIAFLVLYVYFYYLTPNVHTSWPLVGEKNEALMRIFLVCQIGGFWDELVWINFVFGLMLYHFHYWEANFAGAFFFTAFLYDVAFFGAGLYIVYIFAIIQGYTYYKTKSLLYLVCLHFIVDLVLFYMVANKWFPGYGW